MFHLPPNRKFRKFWLNGKRPKASFRWRIWLALSEFLRLLANQNVTFVSLFCTQLPFFCTVLPKNCIPRSQSQSRNFFMYIIRIVRSNTSSIVVLEGEYLSLCGYCLVLTFSSVALMLFFTLFLSSGQFLWYWLKQLCLWLCQPLIICFVVDSWFWDRHWLYTMSRSLAASIYWVSLWFMRFSRCLSYLSTTLAVHSDSIGSLWNLLFATRKVWVYNCSQIPFLSVQHISGRLIFVRCAQCTWYSVPKCIIRKIYESTLEPFFEIKCFWLEIQWKLNNLDVLSLSMEISKRSGMAISPR